MSKLNIQQKASLIAQKGKDSRAKEQNLSEGELKRLEYEEDIKPNFDDHENELVEKYLKKFAPLGNYKEHEVYEFIKKYDWNEKVMEGIVAGMLKNLEQAGNFEGWTQVKRVEKPQANKPEKDQRNFQKNKRFQKDNGQREHRENVDKKPEEGGEEQKNFRKQQRPYNEDRRKNYEQNQTEEYQEGYYNNNYYNQDRKGQNKRYYNKNENQQEFVPKYVKKEKYAPVEYYVKKSQKPQDQEKTEQTEKQENHETKPQEKHEVEQVKAESHPHHKTEESHKKEHPVKKHEHKEETKPVQNSVHVEDTKHTKVHATPSKAKEETVNVSSQHPDNISQRANKPSIAKPEPSVPAPIPVVETKQFQTPEKPTVKPQEVSHNSPTKSEPSQQGLQTAPQQIQAPVVMPPFAQQPIFNPYMPMMQPPIIQQPGNVGVFDNKEVHHPMFQVPYIVFPQPNGTCIIQPLMMPQMPPMMPMPTGTPEKDQSRQPQVNYMPVMQGFPSFAPPAQERQQAENRQQPNVGGFFNFPTNEENKKSQAPGQPILNAAPQYPPFMPFMMPMNNMAMGPFGGQPTQHKSGENAGANSFFKH